MHMAVALGRALLVDLLMGKLYRYGSVELENPQTFPSVSRGGRHFSLLSQADMGFWVIL